ncbi:kinesin heavy chain [Pygocentrus nattereri]|uniref:kinesin heavy chain n=1 Tax=Pygocentrus nattereri TaxID=42514 RepID=UPI0018914FCC|nr:kinesin heavy chain [Pygocentrus nattereri]
METHPNSKSFRVVLRLCPPEHMESAEPQVSVRVSGLNSVTAETGRGHRAHVLDFDAVWSEGASLRDVYESTAKPLVEWVIRGYNGCLILYGPSNSVDPHSVQSSSCRLKGIISQAADQIFSSPECSLCKVRVSFYHISNEKIYDLLEPQVSEVCRIHDTEEAVLLEGLREVEVSSAQELLQMYRRGTAHRNAGVSKGDFASKSHMVLNIIVIHMRGQFKEGPLAASKLTLVDLASSGKAVLRSSAVQDVRRSFHVAPENLQEAKTLKRSLTIFRNVIFSLSSAGCQHVPYRESKLTRTLRDCLGGNCRTCLLVAVATQSSSVTETISCLQFAAQAMSVPSRSIHTSQMCYTTAQVQNVWTERSAHPLIRAQMFPPVSADRRSQASLPPILATSGAPKPKPRSSLDSSESRSFLPQLEKPSQTDPNGRYGRGSQSGGEKSRAVDVCVLKGAFPLSSCHSNVVLSSSSSSLASSLASGTITECPNCKQERKIREEYDKFIIQVKRDRDSLSQRVTELEKELKKRGGEEIKTERKKTDREERASGKGETEKEMNGDKRVMRQMRREERESRGKEGESGEEEKAECNGGERTRENDSMRKESSTPHGEKSAEERLLSELNRMRQECEGLRERMSLSNTQLETEKAELMSHIDNSKSCYEKLCLENAELKARLEALLKNGSRLCSGCHGNMESHTSHTHTERHSSHTHTVTTNTEMLLMSHCVSQQCTTDLPHGSKGCFSSCPSFLESSECGFTERSSEPVSHSCHCDSAQHKPSLYKQLRREHTLLLDVMLVLYKREWFLQDAMPYVRRTLRKCGLSLDHTD